MIENNKLIAEFMGLTHCSEGWITMPYEKREGVIAVEICKELKYDESWDWLMPVVGKIYETSGFFSVNGINGELALAMRDGLAEADMDEVYQAVVNFIESHNKKGESK